MSTRILRMFTYCLTIAVLINIASIAYIKRYQVHIGEIRFNQDLIGATAHWDVLITMLMCDKNSTDCTHGLILSDNSITTVNGLYDFMELQHDLYSLCPKVPPGLGPVKYDISIIQLTDLDAMYNFLKPGGIYNPPHCIPRQSVAIIVPMQKVDRTWKNYIGTFLYYIHPFLMKQLSQYQIFVIVQGEPSEPFARGKLLNSGFLEAQKMKRSGWGCMVFHDAYLVPTDTRNMYRCGKWPRRLTSQNRKINKFGGAVTMTPSLFKKINGFSNLDWRNDQDYVNMYERLRARNCTIQTNRASIGRYITLNNIPDLNVSRPETSHATTPIHLIDGLVSLDYKVVNIEFKRLFTQIQVDFHTTKY